MKIDNDQAWKGHLERASSYLTTTVRLLWKLIKGAVTEDTEDAEYKIDGLSGRNDHQQRRRRNGSLLGWPGRFRPIHREASRKPAEKESPVANSNNKDVLIEPIFDRNPIALQVLGICSALAVTSKMETSVVMALSVIFVWGSPTLP